MKNTYQELAESRAMLELPEQTTMNNIKTQYRNLLKRWHPDKCQDNKEKCHEMTMNIIAAYTRIMAYCSDYKISFAREEIREYLSSEEWWFERFGDDPICGGEKR